MPDLTRFDFHAMRFVHSDTVRAMSDSEVGQYILLLCEAWLSGKEATLPNDEIDLARLIRVSKISSKVLKQFDLVDTPWGKRLRNNVLFGEWQIAVNRSVVSRKAAEERWSRPRDADAMLTHYSIDADAMPSRCIQSNPNQSIPNQTNPESTCTSGDFKIMRTRWYSWFKKDLSKSKRNIEQYFEACSNFGEDWILNEFEDWAAQNMWVAENPKGGNRLYVFLDTLPVRFEGRKLSLARSEDSKTKQDEQIQTSVGIIAKEHAKGLEEDAKRRAELDAEEEASRIFNESMGQ